MINQSEYNFLLLTLLDARKDEKDYFLRNADTNANTTKYIVGLSENIDTLRAGFVSANLDSTTEAEVINDLDNYESKFMEVVALDIKIASETAGFSAIVLEMEDDINNLRALIQFRTTNNISQIESNIEQTTLFS